MGKGSRNREVRIADQEAVTNGGMKLSKKQLIKQQEQKEKTKKIITMVATIAILVAVIVGVVVVSLNKTPKLEGNISATSEKYEIDNAMMAYFLYSQYNTFVNNNYYYLNAYGLDPSISLKYQNTPGSNTSWFTYFMNSAKVQVNELVAMASEAQAKGVSLDEKEVEEIDHDLSDMAASVKKNGYRNLDKYLATVYTAGVTEGAVRKCLLLQKLASKYYEQLLDTEEFTYTDEEMEKYVKDNPESFYKFDYVYYDFTPTFLKPGTTDDEKKAAIEDAKKKAEEFIAKVTDEASFKNLIVELEKAAEEEAKATDTTSAATGTGDEKEKTDEDYLKNFIKKGEAYKASTDFGKWAFDDERKTGDFDVIELTTTKKVDGKDVTEVTGYAVYFLTQAKYRDDYATKDVRHILFTKNTYGSDAAAKAKAEEILAEFNKGDKTAEAFGELAKKYTEDSNGDEGGLYENVLKDYMVTEFNDWMYDEKREVGDVEIVKTTYGYHIMYHVGDGEIAWKLSAESYLEQEDYEEYLKALEKTYPVTYDNAKLATIP